MRKSMISNSRLMIAVAILLSSAAPAATREPWVGERVITRNGTVLVEKNQGDDEKHDTNPLSGRHLRVGRVYRVEKADGGWLFLRAETERASGWVKVGDVIPFAQAFEYFTDAINKNPSSNNYVGRGVVLYLQGNNRDALDDFNEAMRIDPLNEGAYLNRGIIWIKQGEFDKAVSDLTEAIRLNPKYAPSYFSRGNAWLFKKEYDKALADYSEVIRLDPRYASAGYHSRGTVWVTIKEYDKAIADYSQAIRIDPGAGRAYLNRGDVWYFKNNYKNAVADYTQAILLNPTDASAYNNRAWVWATCPEDNVRDGKRAVASASRACELTAWGNANYIETLADAYAESGDFDAAIRYQSKALGLLKEEMSRQESLARLALFRAKMPYHEAAK